MSRVIGGVLAAFLGLVGLAAWPAAAQEPAPVAGPTVLVGVAGLSWVDVDPDTTPALWGLVEEQAVASLTVRSVRFITCPIDGWLSVSAGRRAADAEDTWCRPLPRPQVDGRRATVPGWLGYVAAQEEFPYDAKPGLLGDALAGGGACAVAVGPGAAMALADSTGAVGRYLENPADLTAGVLGDCPTAVVDLGGLPDAGAARRAAVREIDAAVADLRRALPAADQYVAGIADYGPGDPPVPGGPGRRYAPALRLALWAGPEGPQGTDGADVPGPSWITALSTRWTGLVQLLDLAPLVTRSAGVPAPDGFVGRPWRTDGRHPPTTAETVAELVGAERAAEVFRVQSGPFFLLLGLVELVVFGAAYATLRSRPGPRLHRLVLRGIGGFALGAAAFPVASFLANLVRWWRIESAALVLWPTILLLAGGVAVLASAGPWRHRVYGPSTVVAGISALVLAADVLTGSVLQRSSLLGLSPLTAGRFYGFGNIAYAVFAAACLVLAGGLAQALRDRGATPRRAALVVVLVGAASVVVGGAPFAGADFGGVIASICGFAVLTLGVLGVRLTWGRVLLVAVLAVTAVALIAWLDWLRPPETRTHFGDFVQSVVDGTAGTTVLRKAEAAIGTLRIRPYYGWLVPIVSVAIIAAFHDPVRTRAVGLAETQQAWPLLRPLVHAGLVTGFVGFAVNDSGIIVPALLLTIGIPLVVAATARAQPSRAGPRAR